MRVNLMGKGHASIFMLYITQKEAFFITYTIRNKLPRKHTNTEIVVYLCATHYFAYAIHTHIL